jgi:hypothetical protein
MIALKSRLRMHDSVRYISSVIVASFCPVFSRSRSRRRRLSPTRVPDSGLTLEHRLASRRSTLYR